mmetsp:Transcript_29573/g.68532  ORF Transcript_29573/g.68532 Transcript_29573/m.68532 type:complete len:305 (-) Transcript_29573:245-1159(-)
MLGQRGVGWTVTGAITKLCQQPADLVLLLLSKGAREVNGEVSVEVTVLRGEVVLRHAFSTERNDTVLTCDTVLLQGHHVPVQVRHLLPEPYQRLEEGDPSVMVQVIALTTEAGVRLLLELEDHVAGCDAWLLLGLPLEHNLVLVGHASLNLNVECDSGHFDFVAPAVRALVAVHHAASIALVASGLHLHVETRHHLLDSHADTLSIAGLALLLLTILGTSATAFLADLVPADVALLRSSRVQLLKCHRQVHLGVRTFALARPATEKLRKGILHTPGLLVLLQPVDALQVEHLTLFGVAQHFVRT